MRLRTQIAAVGALALAAVPATPALAATAINLVPHQVVVRFDNGASASDRAEAFAAVDAAGHAPITGVPRVHVVRLPADEPVASALADLRANPDVAWAIPDGRRHVTRTPNDPLFGSLWGLPHINAPTVWDTITGTPAVTVGVVDTGISPDHPDLVANERPELSRNFVTFDEPGVPTAWADLEGHGTHVSGTIAAVGDNGVGVTGVNWSAGVVTARALDANGAGDDSDIVSALGWAAEHARVVNGSFGGYGEWGRPLYQAVVDAHPDTLFVFAAGNDTEDVDATTFLPCGLRRPNVVCVAAIDSANQLAGFSNYGRTMVDLGAPGADITSTTIPFAVVDDQSSASAMGAWTQTPGGSWTLQPGTDADHPPYLVTQGTLTPSGGPSGTLTTLTLPAGPTYTGQGCRASFGMGMNLDGDHSLFVEGRNPSVSGGAWVPLVAQITGSLPSGMNGYALNLLPFDGTTGTVLRFRVEGTAATFGPPSGQYVALSSLQVGCVSAQPPEGVYATLSGTSMASPHVAGAAALLLARRPDLSVAQLRNALVSTAVPTPALVGKTVTGGRLDVAAALAALPPLPPVETPAPPRAALAGAAGTTLGHGATVATTAGGRRVAVPIRCTGEPGGQCRFDLVIQQRVNERGHLRWRTWGALRRQSVPVGWHGRRNVPLGATARGVLARHSAARVSLLVMRLSDATAAPAGATRTGIRIRRA